MVRRVRDGAKERFWREAVRRQRTSGLTIRAFCRVEGFSEHGFHWWRRELERRASQSRELERRRAQRAKPVAARRSARRVDALREPSSLARFAPVTVTPASLTPFATSAAYEVHLPSGVRVLVHASANEQLRDVLAALERATC
jgi:hypothetical protein